MPKRALAQKRPFLLLSMAAALAFYYLQASELPELWFIPVKGAACALLAVYAKVRHGSADAHYLALAMGAAAVADMAIELDLKIGALLFILSHGFAIALYLRNRGGPLSKSESWVAGLIVVLTSLAGWALPYDRTLALPVAIYALVLACMVAAAWTSRFPRVQVGAGAMLFLVSDLLIFARLGPLSGTQIADYLVWPIYYLGQFLIVTGVIQTLRKREPELRVVSSTH